MGGVTYKIEAAAKAGIKKVIIPEKNLNDVLIEDRYRSLVEILPVETIEEVFTYAFVSGQKEGFLERIKNLAVRSSTKILDSALPKPAV